jgi:hypothetical protein
MKIAGFLLILAGWLLVLAALVMLPGGASRSAFVLAGMAVEALAVALLFRSHRIPHRSHE